MGKDEAAMFLAQILHESDGLRAKKEYYNPLSEANYGQYTGRGYIQLSGDYNYRTAGDALGYDYLNNPSLVEQEKHAWLVSAWYWNTEVHRHVPSGFRATTELGIRPLTPHHESRERLYSNVCSAFRSQSNSQKTEDRVPSQSKCGNGVLYYPNVANGCKSFFQCVPLGNGQFKSVEQQCPAGLLFNKKTLTCDWPANVEC
jgi:hypothetical protein